MPFPFLPFGAMLALAVLGGAFAAFALALRLLDRAGLTARRSIASGLVAGLRGWYDSGEPSGPSGSLDVEAFEEVDHEAPPDVPLERVHRR